VVYNTANILLAVSIVSDSSRSKQRRYQCSKKVRQTTYISL